MRLIDGIFVWSQGCLRNSYTRFMSLSAGTVIKKELKEPMLKFSLGLYCLVVMFVLLYVICVFLEQKTHGKAKENPQRY